MVCISWHSLVWAAEGWLNRASSKLGSATQSWHTSRWLDFRRFHEMLPSRATAVASQVPMHAAAHGVHQLAHLSVCCRELAGRCIVKAWQRDTIMAYKPVARYRRCGARSTYWPACGKVKPSPAAGCTCAVCGCLDASSAMAAPGAIH